MLPSPIPCPTNNRTLPLTKAKRLTANGDIPAHRSALIVVNRFYNDSIETLRSLRQ